MWYFMLVIFSLISEHILLYSKYIGINVSIDYRIFESSVSLFVANIILYFTLAFAVSIYYFIMVLLTIDRFLVFHLKFRYHFYFSPSKILKLIIAVASVSFLNSTILAILTSMQIIMWFKVENKIFLVYVVFDAGYTFLVIGTYSFILKVYRNQRKFNKATKSTNKKDSFKVLVTTLIIRTFMMYNFIPGTNLCLSMKL